MIKDRGEHLTSCCSEHRDLVGLASHDNVASRIIVRSRGVAESSHSQPPSRPRPSDEEASGARSNAVAEPTPSA
jgi:hypothetical protein